MEVSELRIGNFIQHEDPDEVIEGIHYIEEGTYKVLIGDYLRDLNSIEPIPLTEDWLLKLGFTVTGKMQKGNNIYSRDTSFYDIVINPTFYLRIYENYRVQSIEYVHQLQNLYFALTGEELTIK